MEQMEQRSLQMVRVVAPKYGQMVHNAISEAGSCPESLFDGFGSLFQQQELLVDQVLTKAVHSILRGISELNCPDETSWISEKMWTRFS